MDDVHNTGSAAAYPPPRTLYIIIYIIQGHDTCTCTLVPSSTTGILLFIYNYTCSFRTALYALSREAVSSLRNQNLASKDFSQKQDGRFPAGECALYDTAVGRDDLNESTCREEFLIG